jgi:hypothetical protein
MPDIERVPLREVRDLVVIGEALPFRVLDEAARLLLNAGQAVTSERQFEMLVERGAWAERPAVDALRLARGDSAAALARPVRRATLFDLWEQAVWDLDDLTRRLARGRAQAPEIEAYAARFVALVDRDVDVALFGCIRQDDPRFALYALTHGVHCAVLGWLTAWQLGWNAERGLCLVKAALTMNLAMSELQAVLAEQRDPPSKRQLDQIRAHPHASAALLRQAGVSDADWLSTVEDHHERPDAGGYPRGIAQVSDLATLLRAADVFMAKISPRAIRAAMSPQLAARQLFQQDGGAPLATALIRAVGVYPPGSLVQLASGEVGVVTHRAVAGRAAQVATLSDRKGQPVAATQHRDTGLSEFAVTGPLKDNAGFPRVLPERVYGLIPA